MVGSVGAWRTWAGLLAGCAASLSVWPQASTSSIFTCVDARGRVVTADRPIAECSDRTQKELAPSGAVRRSIGPVLSEREQAEQEARKRQAAEEARRVQDARRRDRALLSRYPNQSVHDAERAQALAQVDEAIASAQRRIVDLQQQRKSFDVEMEFYAKDPAKAPALLRNKYVANDEEQQAQRRFIADQEQEKQRVNARFDAEQARLRQLWAEQASVSAP